MNNTAQVSSAWLRRVAGLVRKEMLQIRRDPSSYLIAGVLPLLMLFIFGYGVSLDLRRVPVAVVIEQSTPEADSLLASFRNSRYFDVTFARHRAEVEDDLVAGELQGRHRAGGRFFRATRARRVGAGAGARRRQRSEHRRPGAQLRPRGVEQLAGAGGDRAQRPDRRGRAWLPPVTIEPRYWFNPEFAARTS